MADNVVVLSVNPVDLAFPVDFAKAVAATLRCVYDTNSDGDPPLNSSGLLSVFRSPSELRIQWMRLMGMDDVEIADRLLNDPASDVEHEEQELRAMIAVREMQADSCSVRSIERSN